MQHQRLSFHAGERHALVSVPSRFFLFFFIPIEFELLDCVGVLRMIVSRWIKIVLLAVRYHHAGELTRGIHIVAGGGELRALLRIDHFLNFSVFVDSINRFLYKLYVSIEFFF